MNRSSSVQESRLQQMQPLILYGMHRSGTSLTVRLLVDVGIHMGSWLSRDAESVHFQRLNRRIYAAAGSKWGTVDALVGKMESEAFIAQQASLTRDRLFQRKRFPGQSLVIESFLGGELWQKVQQGESFPWGWKDPRTTLTLPVWTRIFPQARWVHVIRNGIDVAISTHRRSLKQQRKLRNRLLPLDYSPETLDFAYSFRLWEAYVSFALAHKDLIPPDQHMEMRYEDLLANPEEQLERLLAFLGGIEGGGVDPDAIAAACRQIDRGRLDNSRYAAAYRDEIESLKSSALMQQLGYGYARDL